MGNCLLQSRTCSHVMDIVIVCAMNHELTRLFKSETLNSQYLGLKTAMHCVQIVETLLRRFHIQDFGQYTNKVLFWNLQGSPFHGLYNMNVCRCS